MKGFLQRILQEIMKKEIILGTSDAWSMRRSSHRLIDTAYYIEDCRISVLSTVEKLYHFFKICTANRSPLNLAA